MREPRALQVLCETVPLPAGTHAHYTKALSSGILEMELDGNLERNMSPRQKTYDPVLFHQFHTLPALQASLLFGTKSVARASLPPSGSSRWVSGNSQGIHPLFCVQPQPVQQSFRLILRGPQLAHWQIPGANSIL